MPSSLLLAGAGAAALALAACGGGGGGPSGPAAPTPPPSPSNPTPPPAASATVAMRTDTDVYGAASSVFAPTSVAIARNGRVTWTNASGVAHNVTFDGTSGAPADVADHAAGDNLRTFAAAGTFGYTCTNHAGMSGTVVVAP